jgi:uncharacterized protein (DUF433 family)
MGPAHRPVELNEIPKREARELLNAWPPPDDLKRASRLPASGRQRSLRCMLDWTKCSTAVERVPGKVSGAWVFKGTRVPVHALFENFEGGATVDQFLEWLPRVTREQALVVLKFAESSLAVQTA